MVQHLMSECRGWDPNTDARMSAEPALGVILFAELHYTRRGYRHIRQTQMREREGQDSVGIA